MDTPVPTRRLFELSEAEKVDRLWLKLLAHFEAELQSARERNEVLDLTDKERGEVIGRLKTYRTLVRLNDPPKQGDDVR